LGRLRLRWCVSKPKSWGSETKILKDFDQRQDKTDPGWVSVKLLVKKNKIKGLKRLTESFGAKVLKVTTI
jgi:hypothetical protein